MARVDSITVPKWGLTMSEGTVVKWLVETGQRIAPGDALIEMETSKIVNEIESMVAGELRRKVAGEGDTLPVGALLGVVAAPEVTEDEIDAFIAGFVPVETDEAATPEQPAAPTPVSAVSQAAGAASTRAGGFDVPASLRSEADDSACNATVHARRFALAHGINLTTVTGSGRGGRISVEDIEAAILAAGGSLPAPAAAGSAAAAAGSAGATTAGAVPATGNPYETVPMSAMRRTIAARLQASKRDAPHFRVSVDVEADALLALREAINRESPQARVTLNDLLIKACAMALVEVPDCNVQFDGETIRRFADADVAVAVPVDGGLITPIVRHANRKPVAAIAAEMRELSARARAGRLQAQEFEGGTFSLSNLGMFGVRQFDAIINPPQAAILAVGAAEKRIVARDDRPAVATVMSLSLACDHRVIDGALAARFLQVLKALLQQPAALSS